MLIFERMFAVPTSAGHAEGLDGGRRPQESDRGMNKDQIRDVMSAQSGVMETSTGVCETARGYVLRKTVQE